MKPKIDETRSGPLRWERTHCLSNVAGRHRLSLHHLLTHTTVPDITLTCDRACRARTSPPNISSSPADSDSQPPRIRLEPTAASFLSSFDLTRTQWCYPAVNATVSGRGYGLEDSCVDYSRYKHTLPRATGNLVKRSVQALDARVCLAIPRLNIRHGSML
jgi:hypothetical protein